MPESRGDVAPLGSARASIKPLPAAFVSGAAALLSMLWLFGFTVDDALISARVAHQLASGHGYRFNPGGPIVDAVTPLGWAPLLAPFARSGVWPALEAARVIGLLAWLTAASWLGVRLAAIGRRALWLGALALLLTTPLAAWAVSGMETGLVIALCAFALSDSAAGRVALGLAVALRPELCPWALTLAVGRAVLSRSASSKRIAAGLLAAGGVLAPLIAVAVLRSWLFGAAYPLALEAKPPELSSGLRYALGALALSGPPWLLLAGRDWAHVAPQRRVPLLALLAHAGALIVVGGDWMPLYRLFVPVLPSVILLAAELGQRASTLSLGLRLTPFLAATAFIALSLAPSSRRVWAQRAALVERARPLLAGARRPATLDIGWVGAASDAALVDLAGVTDPAIARLPGGHTTKRLPDSLLERREVDALILLAERPELSRWPELDFVRGVEQRVVHLASAERFEPLAIIPLRGTTRAYVIARKRAP